MANKLDILLTVLNKSDTAQKDKPLNQLLKDLIQALKELSNIVGSSSGSGSSVVNNITEVNQFLNPLSSLFGDSDENRFYIPISSDDSNTGSDDYVVTSDGGLPTPLPIDDGFGNFIYVLYTA